MPGKTPHWRPPDSCSAKDILAPHLTNADQKELAVNGICYQSRDMKTGFDLKKLMCWVPLLARFFSTDPRGAYFRQADIEDIIADVYNTTEWKATALAAATKADQSLKERVLDETYGLRVMLSHLREKYYAWKNLMTV